jgi:hypothetical protein
MAMEEVLGGVERALAEQHCSISCAVARRLVAVDPMNS